MVSVDVGVYKNKYHGDSAYTFAIGLVPAEVQQLMSVTRESLNRGIEKAITGNRTGDIANAIQDYAEKQHAWTSGFLAAKAIAGNVSKAEINQLTV